MTCGSEPISRCSTGKSKEKTRLSIWESSEWEKPESLKVEGLCAVRSSKARRLTHIKPGYYTPPSRPDLRAGNALARGHRGGALGPAGSASARGDALVVLT